MQFTGKVIFVMFPILFAGCAGQKIREGMYQGIYEGSRIENKRGTTPAENAGKPDLDYDRYTRHREELLKRDVQ